MARSARARQRSLRALVVALGTFVHVARAEAEPAELRVVTFNVAMDLAFRSPLAGLVRETFEHNEHLRHFDVIGLQEACLNDRSSIDLFRGIMLRAHGRVFEHAVLADPLSHEPCKKAQVILSRYPIYKKGGLTLPQVGAKRSAAWVDLLVGGRRLRIYDLHLSNREGRNYAPVYGRLSQARVVLGHWLAERRKHPRARGIILGDFNAMGDLWSPSQKERAVVELGRFMTPNLRSFIPTMFMPYQSDWIFSNGVRLRQSQVIPTVYSDHFVVVADYWF